MHASRLREILVADSRRRACLADVERIFRPAATSLLFRLTDYEQSEDALRRCEARPEMAGNDCDDEAPTTAHDRYNGTCKSRERHTQLCTPENTPTGAAAQVDAGKTTTTEQLLVASGRRARPGRVDTGSTATDFLPAERERGITIQSAAVHFWWRDTEVALIDTPGHVDFGHEVDRSLAVLDGVVLVVDAVAGAQARTEVVARGLKKMGLPSLVLVNKMDRPGADLAMAVDSVRQRCPFLPPLVAVHEPLYAASEGFIGFVDHASAMSYAMDDCRRPLRHQEHCSESFGQIVETLCDFDDELAEAYLDDQVVDAAQVRAALGRATRRAKCCPVLCAAMLRGIGVEALLEAIIDYLPSPDDRGLVPDEKPFQALAFKVADHKYKGPLVYCRAYHGVVPHDTKRLTWYNNHNAAVERPTSLLLPFADALEPIDRDIMPGDIFVAVGLKQTRSGHTLSAKPNLVALEASTCFPTPGSPVFALAIEPDRASEYNQLVDTLRILERDDPSLKVDTTTDETVTLAGMGELHLQIAIDRLRREFGLRFSCGQPTVKYSETISCATSKRAVFERHHQTSGRLYCAVDIRLEPCEKQMQVAITTPPNLQADITDAVRDGIQAASESGPLEGHPLAHLAVHVLNVDIDLDTTPGAARAAAALALQDAIHQASPLVLEPILALEVDVSHDRLGDVLADLAKKRNTVVLETHADMAHQSAPTHTVHASAPLSELLGYATHLRSITAGQAHFQSHFSHYAPRQP